MSWWTTREGAGGTRELWIIDFDPVLTIALVALPIIFLVNHGLLSTVLLLAGFMCLVVAKLSLFRRGTWVSWGPRLLSARNGSLYKAAYALIVCGAALRLVLGV